MIVSMTTCRYGLGASQLIPHRLHCLPRAQPGSGRPLLEAPLGCSSMFPGNGCKIHKFSASPGANRLTTSGDKTLPWLELRVLQPAAPWKVFQKVFSMEGPQRSRVALAERQFADPAGKKYPAKERVPGEGATFRHASALSVSRTFVGSSSSH